MKDLIKRLKDDIAFKLNCGFLISDTVPSESSYSRLITKLEESNILEDVLEKVVLQAMEEGFITDDTVAIDATHFEARDQAPQKEEKPKPEPKKRGRKPKEEGDEWLKEQAEKESNLSLYEKKIEVQLDTPLDELRAETPLAPKWGVKKNSEGKNVYWFGYKGHLAVGTSSQYILQTAFSPSNLNDGKMAIPLLKGIHENLPFPSLCYQTMDADHDYEPIYEQVHRIVNRITTSTLQNFSVYYFCIFRYISCILISHIG